MIATQATVIDTDIFFTIYGNMHIGMRQAHCDMYMYTCIFLVELYPQIIRALADNYS